MFEFHKTSVMSRVQPHNPFLVMRGLDQAVVKALRDEYQKAYEQTQVQVYMDRRMFMDNLLPFVAEHCPQTPEEAAEVKAKVAALVVRRLPLVKQE